MNWRARYEEPEISVRLSSDKIIRDILKENISEEFIEERAKDEFIIDCDHPAAQHIECFYKGNKIKFVSAIKIKGMIE